MLKQKINIVWFKRDLRFTDNEPLFLAQKESLPILLLYCFEPSVMAYDDSDVRHWRFVYESLMDMNLKLQDLKAQVYIFHNQVQPVFQCLAEEFDIQNVFSHQEIGNKLTFDRDLQMQTFLKEKEINWKESRTNGIIRRLKNRSDWEKRWKTTMTSEPKLIDEENTNFLRLEDEFYQQIKGPKLDENITKRNVEKTLIITMLQH